MSQALGLLYRSALFHHDKLDRNNQDMDALRLLALPVLFRIHCAKKRQNSGYFVSKRQETRCFQEFTENETRSTAITWVDAGLSWSCDVLATKEHLNVVVNMPIHHPYRGYVTWELFFCDHQGGNPANMFAAAGRATSTKCMGTHTQAHITPVSKSSLDDQDVSHDGTRSSAGNHTLATST